MIEDLEGTQGSAAIENDVNRLNPDDFRSKSAPDEDNDANDGAAFLMDEQRYEGIPISDFFFGPGDLVEIA